MGDFSLIKIDGKPLEKLFDVIGHGYAIPTPPSPTLPAPAMLRIAL